MARATKIGYVCAREMVARDGIEFSRFDKLRCACVFGVVDAGHSRIYDNQYWVIKTMPHAVSAWLAIEYGLEGLNVSVSAACASSAFSIGQAYDLIRLGRADAVLTGGTSAIVNPEHVDGFNEVGALSCANGDPARASKPFSRGRDGFVMGEGAATLLLESLDSARARQAPIYAEMLGYAATSECYNIVAPVPGGAGMAKTMREALRDARLGPERVDYINAHGTSTALNDKYETLAIREVFGGRAASIPVSAPKSMIGHTAGACGAVEAAITIQCLRTGIVHPTINYDPDPDLDLDYVPHQARRHDVRVALSNSFGFGGCNACLVFGRFEP
jgi:3-oxoacyl-[acyl-carrier-protein] synthase II